MLKNLKWLRNNLRNIESKAALYYDLDDLKVNLSNEELSYIKYILKLVEQKETDSGINIDKGTIHYEIVYYDELENNHPVKRYVNADKRLVELNKLRIRNVIIFDNKSHQVIYDLVEKETKTVPKIPVSNFERDTNRPFLEAVCRDFLFDFDRRKDYYAKLLKKHGELYGEQLDILTGNKDGDIQEILTLISLLGRLHQVNKMGPLSTYREEKLYPSYISKNITALTYVRETIKTFVEYREVFLLNSKSILQIPNINRGVVVYDDEHSDMKDNSLLAQIMDPNIILSAERLPSTYGADGIFRPNYLLSFFTKFISSLKFEKVTPLFNSNEDLSDLIAYSKRYRGNPKKQDFMIAAKTRSVLMNQSPSALKHGVHEVFMYSKNNTYSRKVAAYLIDQNENILKELLRAFFIFDNHVEKEKAKFKEENKKTTESEYNNAYLSISSDMHFNELNNYEKTNYSTKFNIIAGDFADNLYHRGNSALEGVFTLPGIGVLGNHDVYLDSTPTRNLSREIKNNFKKSISVLKKHFPKIKILNDEVMYKDGYAIIGMNLVYDMKNNERTFFANREWGKKFDDDDYLKRAKALLDQVPAEVPIIFISHSPFKEYAVCSNTDLGVPTKRIFKKYPNVKIYIHGHGHSMPKTKMIDGVLCITNPLVMNKMISEVSFTKEELFERLGIDTTAIKLVGKKT
ncbi:MAG TPA: metallophosphoesterase [Bacilli bacterium]|nr:metallophosphoesterase [Bacilli bacterium]